MNNPKDKAKELVDKFTVVGLQQRNEGIACALITIDEMLKVGYYSDDKIYDYLHEVKQEIEKL